jgi:cell division protein FtsB
MMEDRLSKLQEDNERLQKWVNDLQSGMYINCVYCGHRYGPRANTPVSMAEVLKEHIENCEKHPMAELKRENDRLSKQIKELKHHV